MIRQLCILSQAVRISQFPSVQIFSHREFRIRRMISQLIYSDKIFCWSFSSSYPGYYIKYDVEKLQDRALQYLQASDSAQASEKTYQAFKLTIMNCVAKIEAECKEKIIPPDTDPWTYDKYRKFCNLIIKKRPNDAREITCGLDAAKTLHVMGWSQNALNVEEVRWRLDTVNRLIEIIERLEFDQRFAVEIREEIFSKNWRKWEDQQKLEADAKLLKTK